MGNVCRYFSFQCSDIQSSSLSSLWYLYQPHKSELISYIQMNRGHVTSLTRWFAFSDSGHSRLSGCCCSSMGVFNTFDKYLQVGLTSSYAVSLNHNVTIGAHFVPYPTPNCINANCYFMESITFSMTYVELNIM